MYIAQTKNGPVEYRIENPKGSRAALILHGGHMNASVHLGEDYFVEEGYRTIIVSRPGYGKTPLKTGETPQEFAIGLKELLDQLGINKVVLVGISAGGRSAMAFAADYPERVEKLILQCAVSFEKWPDAMTNVAAHIAFNSFTEKYTWSLLRVLLKKKPRVALRFLLGSMTTKSVSEVIAGFNDRQVGELVEIFSHSGSGKGFLADIRSSGGDARNVSVPTLIIHSKFDKSVSIEHAKLLHQQIKSSELYISNAESHMIWFSVYYDAIKKRMNNFLQ